MANKVVVRISLNADDVRSCVESGMTIARSWCGTRRTGEKLRLVEERPADGDKVTSCPWPITNARLARALRLMAAGSPRQFGNLVAGDGDAETGDLVIQYAVLGRVVYA